LQAAKEIYEAAVLHDFLELMFHWAGVAHGKPVPKTMLGRHVHFGPPLDWFMPFARFDNDLLQTLEFWTVQYVLVQPVIALAHIFLGHYLHEHIALGWILLAAYAVSTTLSLSALIGFFHTFETEIAAHAPLRKLLCVKGVVAVG
jgi:hypothetical protein